MDLRELKRIKQELESRTIHPDKNVQKAYKNEGVMKRDVMGTDPNYAGFDKEGLKNLEIKHFEKIREDLNDDAGFKNILEQIKSEDIETKLAEKKHLLDDLKKEEPPLATPGQIRYTRWTKNENNAEIARSKWRNEKRTLENEIDLILEILTNIDKLLPIYEPKITSAGKKRTRRNRKSKKSKKGKSRKNRRKSNRHR